MDETFEYDGNGNITKSFRHGDFYAAPKDMDDLTYNYNRDANGRLLNNKLDHINDAIPFYADNNTHDLHDQSAGNYQYDAIGNLTADQQSNISNVNWSVYGKIQSISKTDGPDFTYTYYPDQKRATQLWNGITTYYVRDAQGNTLAIYDNKGGTVNWREQDLYGSSRLGMWTPNVNLANNNASTVWDTTGHKQYELTNHLGNVLATITDKRIPYSPDGTTIAYYQPEVTTAQEYFAFGFAIPARNYTLNQPYRYGFNGKENDNQVKLDFDGKGIPGNQQDYGMRIYDPGVGRFLSVDPLQIKYPQLTPYQFASNTPIQAVDLDGQERFNYNILFDKKGTAYLSYAGKQDIIDYTYKLVLSVCPIIAIPEVNKRQEFVIRGPITRYFDNMGNITSYTDEDEETFKTYQEASKYVKKYNGINPLEYSFIHQLMQGVLYMGEEERTGGSFSGMMRPAGGAPSLREGVGSKPSEVVNIEVKMMEGWTPEQQTAARNKIANANAMDPTVVENMPAREKNLRNLYKKAGGEVSSTQDVDHILDLQLGGTNNFSNLQGLDQSVNRSLGSQIQNQIKNLAPGTKVNIIIKGP